MGFPPLLNLPTAAMPGQTTKTALTEEFMFQNVAYRPTDQLYIELELIPYNSTYLKMKTFLKKSLLSLSFGKYVNPIQIGLAQIMPASCDCPHQVLKASGSPKWCKRKLDCLFFIV